MTWRKRFLSLLKMPYTTLLFFYLISLHYRAILVLFPNMEIIKGNKQIYRDKGQRRNQNLSSASGPFPFSRETSGHMDKSNI